MVQLLPSIDTSLPRRMADFDTIPEALDYAAKGSLGYDFYSAKGDLIASLPYAELRDQAVILAKKYVKMGLERGARLALVADTSPEFLTAFFACQYAGLLPVPLPLPTSFGGREGYVEQLGKQMKSCTADAAMAPQAMFDLLRQASRGLDIRFIGSHEDMQAMDEPDVDLQPLQSHELCYLQYSSGSTRFPHGIKVSQTAALANCHGNAVHGVKLGDGDRIVSWLPMYHDMGLVGCTLTPMTCQISVDSLPTEFFVRRPMQWMQIMSDNRGTVTYSPSFGYELCARRATPERIADLDLSCIRVAGLGADMIRPKVTRKFAEAFAPAGFRGEAFLASYGLAEATLAVSFAPVGRGIEVDVVDEIKLAHQSEAVAPTADGDGVEPVGREFVNCGIPMPGYELQIRDEDDQLLEDRRVGKIFVKGPSVMSGYYLDPEATARVLDQDGWLDTGDMGYRVGKSLFIVGRMKDLIILNGRNHWPQDIEWAVEQIEGLRSGDAAAFSLPGSGDEEVATILVQCRISSVEERLSLIAEIKRRVHEAVGITCHVALVRPRTLPRTSSGKLSRTKARANYLSGLLEPLEGSDLPPWAKVASEHPSARTVAAS